MSSDVVENANTFKDKLNRYCSEVLMPHLRLHWKIWLSVVIFIVGFNCFFTVAINTSESLPEHVYLITKYDKTVRYGDYVAFRWNGGGPYRSGLNFVKRVKGVAGDHVTVSAERDVFVNDELVGRAKTHSKTGVSLEVAKAGVVPEGYFYVFADHKDSFDSRYAIVGLIKADRIKGKAYPLF